MTQIAKSTGWWHTIPGMLTAVAGIITAATGLIVALNQAGFFEEQEQPVPQPGNHYSEDRQANNPIENGNASSSAESLASHASAEIEANSGTTKASEDKPSAVSQAKVTVLPPGKFGVDAPFPLQFGITYKMTLAHNNDNFFILPLPINKAKIILDMRLASNQRSNLMSTFSILNQDGGVIEDRAIVFNEIDVGHRETRTVSMRQATVLGFRILNRSKTAIFWLTVLTEPDPRFIPFFGEVVPQPLALQETGSGSLGTYDYAYYVASFRKGAYKVIMDIQNFARRNTNLQGYVALLDADGGNRRQIMRINELDVSHRQIGGFSLDEDQMSIIQIHNKVYEINYAVKISGK